MNLFFLIKKTLIHLTHIFTSYNPNTSSPAGVLTGSSTVVLVCSVTAIYRENLVVRKKNWPQNTTEKKFSTLIKIHTTDSIINSGGRDES